MMEERIGSNRGEGCVCGRVADDGGEERTGQ
jgi:hypothetical protein